MIAALHVKHQAIHVKKLLERSGNDSPVYRSIALSKIQMRSLAIGSCYNAAVLQRILVLLAFLTLSLSMVGQQAPNPQVRVNMINACTPSADEQKEISAALAKVPKQPEFAVDFEVDRGRSALEDNSNLLNPAQNTRIAPSSGVSDWVRVRRDMAGQSFFSTVQYSFSVDPQNMIETLVLRVGDPKDLMQLSIEDDASAVTTPLSMLGTNTPVSRVRLERFGKSSIALARCFATEAGPPPDQSAYEPLFHAASETVSRYREILHARTIVPEELAKTREAPNRGSMPIKGTPKAPVKKQN